MKTVLITGGAKRLGRALVEHFARSGWQVLFTAQWSFEEGMALADSLGNSVKCLRAQVSTQSNAALIVEWVSKHTDRLDLVVCNASTFKRIAVADTRPDDFNKLLESNLLGPYFLIQQCIPLLEKANGAVVNIADAQAVAGVPNFSAYAAAKAGLISITKSLALELAPAIRVNAVQPGTLQWPADGEPYPQDERDGITQKIPMQRIGEWQDIVEAVAYLESAKFVTGICLPIDGGRSALA